MAIYLSLIVCIVGGLAKRFARNPRTERLGEIAFAVGLLVFLWTDGVKVFARF